MIRTSNKTEFGIQHSSERYLWISFNVLVVISSLVGDSIILSASLNHTAIKLHKLIIAIIQHLAVSDLVQNVLKVVPQIIALVADAWILPPSFCHGQYHVTVFFAGLTAFLTGAMTCSKLLIVKFPLRSAAWSSRRGHLLCAILWVIGICLHTPQLVASFIYGRDAVYFEYEWYVCNYDFTATAAGSWPDWYLIISFGVGAVTVFVAITYSSVLLLWLARRTAVQLRVAMRWQGVVTVILTVVVFFISCSPWLLIYRSNIQSPPIWRAAQFIQNLNIMANFFIYVGTVKSFREFLKLKAWQIISSAMLRTAASSHQRNRILLRQISRQSHADVGSRSSASHHRVSTV